MRQIIISDITMKQSGKDAGFSLSFKEKIELSKLLDKLEVSVIELHHIDNGKIDSLLVKSIAATVKKSILAVPVHLNAESVQTTWNALKGANHPRLQVAAPVSAVQMEYLSHKKADDMLGSIKETVKACCGLCKDVEFIADDATRSDLPFLQKAIRTAIEAGANAVTVCDTAGTMLPDEFAAFLTELKQNVPELESVALGVSCSDSLSMANSCAVAAVRCGAVEVKATAFSTGVVLLPAFAKIINAKGCNFDACVSLRMTLIKRISGQIAWLCQNNRSKTSAFDTIIADGDSNVLLSSHDDMSAVLKAVEALGYDLSEEDGAKVFEAFRHIAARKQSVGSKELDAIVASSAMQVPPTYKLDSFVINSGNIISATAHIKLESQNGIQEGFSIGDGPIDASFLAIEQITGHHYELDDFQVQAVTEGREAMGQTVIKLRSGGKLYSGRGISTDVIGASILAYINALNKIVYEEENA